MALNVTVVGLEHLGAACAGALGLAGHSVRALDGDVVRITEYRERRWPVREAQLGEVLDEVMDQGRLEILSELPPAVMSADVVIVAVDTPIMPGHRADHGELIAVYKEIAEVLKIKKRPTLLLTAGSVAPGTHERVLRPLLLRRVGDRLDDDIALVAQPHFLRRGCAITDWLKPAFVVLGGPLSSFRETLRELYHPIEAPWLELSYGAAEMLKVASSAFNALKIDFANEIAALCDSVGVDGTQVLGGLCHDRQVSLSGAYLKPGSAYGGPSLPRDVGVLCELAESRHLHMPLLESISPSNDAHLARTWRAIEALKPDHVGLVGLAFKPRTDECRNSPAVTLAERLLERGVPLKIYDPDLGCDGLLGGNRRFLNRHIENLPEMLVERIDDVVEGTDLIIVTHKLPGAGRLRDLLRPDQIVYDLNGELRTSLADHPGYRSAAASPPCETTEAI